MWNMHTKKQRGIVYPFSFTKLFIPFQLQLSVCMCERMYTYRHVQVFSRVLDFWFVS